MAKGKYNGDISIRKITIKDLICVAKIKCESFGSKTGSLYKKDKEILTNMFIDASKNYVPQDVYVAEQNNKILGYIKLKTKYDNCKNNFPWFYFIKNYGLFNTINFFITLSMLENGKPTKKNIGYVSQIAVSSEARGKGIGTLLLKSGETHFKNLKGIDLYTLSVMKENTVAHKFYKRFGFTDVNIYKFPFMKILTGYSAVIYMSKNISNEYIK